MESQRKVSNTYFPLVYIFKMLAPDYFEHKPLVPPLNVLRCDPEKRIPLPS